MCLAPQNTIILTVETPLSENYAPKVPKANLFSGHPVDLESRMSSSRMDLEKE